MKKLCAFKLRVLLQILKTITYESCEKNFHFLLYEAIYPLTIYYSVIFNTKNMNSSRVKKILP